MRWNIFALGKPSSISPGWASTNTPRAIKPVFAPVPASNTLKAADRAGESRVLLERSEGMCRVVLDERGDHRFQPRPQRRKIGVWEQRGPRDFAVLIGGADGHTDELREAADWKWSLSKLTLQHELALVVSLEQLYRAYTIKAGLPYHRD